MSEETKGPMLPVDVPNIERDTAAYCQGCGRDPGVCGPVVRYLFPLRPTGMEELDCDTLYFCRDCSLKVAGAMEEIWHAYDRACGARSDTHYLLQRAAYHLTQATLMLTRMDA